MGDVNLRIFAPPTVPSPKDKSNMPMLYYALAVVGTAAIALVLYNFIIVRMCNRRHMQSSQVERSNGVVTGSSSMSFENSQRNLLSISSFKYKKEVGKEYGDDIYECPICLSVIEEGEEVRKLPRCKHCFHVECIDMWLYSHFDCPVCRTSVGPFFHPFKMENSRQGLMELGRDSV